MSGANIEFVNPNRPYSLFQIFKRNRGPNFTYPDYVSMPTMGLCELACALLVVPDTKVIFEKSGVHGDIGANGEAAISNFIVRYVAAQGWGKPDPANLVASTVLARQLAEGSISFDDKERQIAFIEDKRCDGLGVYERYSPRTPKPLKASEIIPILQWVEQQEELKAPFKPLRGKTFRQGQNFFEDEAEGRSALNRITMMPEQMAVHKYGLFNREFQPLHSLMNAVTEHYIMNKLDRYDGAEAIELMHEPHRIKEIINDLAACGAEH